MTEPGGTSYQAPGVAFQPSVAKNMTFTGVNGNTMAQKKCWTVNIYANSGFTGQYAYNSTLYFTNSGINVVSAYWYTTTQFRLYIASGSAVGTVTVTDNVTSAVVIVSGPDVALAVTADSSRGHTIRTSGSAGLAFVLPGLSGLASVPQSYTGGTIQSSTGSDGSISAITATGGNGSSGYTYLWTFGSGATNFASTTTVTAKTGLAPGIYTLTITNASNSCAFIFTVPAIAGPVTYTGGSIAGSTATGSDGSISAITPAGGSGTGYTYLWTFGTGATNFASTTTVAAKTGLAPATYTLKITDSAAATLTTAFVVPTVANISYSGGAVVSSSTGSNGSIAAITATGGSSTGYTYLWTFGSGATNFAATTTVAAKTALAPATYTLKITDSTGRNASFNFVVVALLPVSFTGGGIVSSTGSDGSVAAITATGGSGTGYTFLWTFGAGATNFTPTNTVTEKTGLASATYILRITDSLGATNTFNFVVPTVAALLDLSETSQLLASDPTADDSLGYSCAIDGDTAVVGAFFWDIKSPATANVGALYVYVKTGEAWIQQQILTGSVANDRLGLYVAILGNTIVAGGYKAVVVFTRASVGATWTEQQRLLSTDYLSTDWFGASVTISGDTIVAGVVSWDNKSPAITDTGTAYVFVRSGSTWTQQAQLLAADRAASDRMGFTISLDGNTVIIGAHFWDQKTPTDLQDCGTAYVFVRDGTTWTQQQQLLASDPSAGDYFGYAVSLSGDTAVVGALNWKTPTAIQCGCVYVYVRSGTLWTQQVRLQPSANPSLAGRFGNSVSISGNTLVCGDRLIGAAYVFERNGATWYPRYRMRASDASAAVDTVGYSVGFSGSTLVTGAYQWDQKTPTAISNCGAAYIRDLSTTNLTITPASVSNVNIYGQSTGSIGLTSHSSGTSPYTYLWTSSNGGSGLATPSTLSAKTNLSAGTYVFKVTDGAGLTGTYTYTITQNPVLSVSGGAVTTASAAGAADGNIAATTVSGGTGTGFTYAWSNSGTGSSTIATSTTLVAKTGLKSGSYTLLATDNVGGTVSQTFVVGQNAALSYTGGALTPVTIYGQSTGQIAAITVAGGSSVYGYSWSSGSGGTTITSNTTVSAKTGLAAATYSLLVTDNRGITATYSFVVAQNAVISYDGGSVVSSTGSNGSIGIIAVSGGTGVYTSYAWTSSSGASTITAQNLTSKTGLKSGSYYLVLTDSAGAVGNFTFVVAVTPAIVLTRGTVTHCTAYSASTGAVSRTSATGGYGALVYSWASSSSTDLSDESDKQLSNLRAGTYVVTVTDAQGTSAAASYAVGEPIYATAIFFNETVDTKGSITITAAGGLGSSYAYAWTKAGSAFPATTASLTNLDVGVYQCTVTTSLFSAVVDVTIATYMAMQASPTVVRATWTDIANATAYKVEYKLNSDTDYILLTSKTLAIYAVISSLAPSSTYRVRVYATTTGNTTFVKYYSDTVTTPAQEVTNFSKLTLQVGTNYNIVPVQEDLTTNPDTVVQNGFESGDTVLFKAEVTDSTRVIEGDIALASSTYQLQKSVVLYIPFDAADTVSLQDTQLTLLNGSSKTVVFDATNGTISIDSITYSVGDVFFIDGQKVTVARG